MPHSHPSHLAREGEMKPDRRTLPFGDFSGTKTARAHRDRGFSVVHDGFDFLDVRFPDAAGFVVGMADVISRDRAFSAYFTLHSYYPFPFVSAIYCVI